MAQEKKNGGKDVPQDVHQTPTQKEQAIARGDDPGVPTLMTASTTWYTLAGYGTNLKTPTDLAGMTASSINDFRVNMTWQHAHQVGEVNTGTDTAPVWEARYIMKTHQVGPYTILQDLIEFQNALNGNMAVNSGIAASTTTTTAPATTT